VTALTKIQNALRLERSGIILAAMH